MVCAVVIVGQCQMMDGEGEGAKGASSSQQVEGQDLDLQGAKTRPSNMPRHYCSLTRSR